MTVSHIVLWKHTIVLRQAPAPAARLRAEGRSVVEFAAATDRVEHDLGRDPDELGESRPDWLRIHHRYPVTVDYEVHGEPNVVFIHRLVYHARRLP